MKRILIAAVVCAAFLASFEVWAQLELKKQSPPGTGAPKSVDRIKTRRVIMRLPSDPLAPDASKKCIQSYQFIPPNAGTPCYDNKFKNDELIAHYAARGQAFDPSNRWGCRFKHNFPRDPCPSGSTLYQQALQVYYCYSNTVNVEDLDCAESNNATFKYRKVNLSPEYLASENSEYMDKILKNGDSTHEPYAYVLKCSLINKSHADPQVRGGRPWVCYDHSDRQLHQMGAGDFADGEINSELDHDVCCFKLIDKYTAQPKKRELLPDKAKGRPEKTRMPWE